MFKKSILIRNFVFLIVLVTCFGVSHTFGKNSSTCESTMIANHVHHVAGIPAMTDTTNCTATDENLNPAKSSAIAITYVVQNVSCNGGNDGKIDISVSGVTGTPEYEWNTGAATDDINTLTAGTYTLTVTVGSEVETISIEVTEPDPISISLSPTDVTCNGGSDGTIDIFVSGGTPDYTYHWSSTEANTNHISNLNARNYSVTVTDANNCEANATTDVGQPTPMNIALTHTPITCNGGSDGQINISVSGGTESYSYAWKKDGEDFSTDANLTGLATGSYTVIVTDDNECHISSSIFLSQPASMNVSLRPINVSCHGGSDGQIETFVSGGTESYSYAWKKDGEDFSTAANLTGLTVGTYTVTVGDGCSYITESATITQPNPITISSIEKQDVMCLGENTGYIIVTASGGTGFLNYSWSGGQSENYSIYGLTAGDYTVTVTDQKNCTLQSDVITITEPESALAITGSVTNVSCRGESSGKIDITVSGGTAPYDYLWNTLATTQDISNLIKGNYIVIVTDANGCEQSGNFTVTEPNSPFTPSINGRNPQCYGSNDGEIRLGMSGGIAPYTFRWSNGETTQNISGLTAGTYTVTATDANGCEKTLSYTLNQPSEMSIIVNNIQHVSCHGGNNGAINIHATGSTGYTYKWAPGGQATNNISGLTAGLYTVTVTDGNNCTVETTIEVEQPLKMGFILTPDSAKCYNENSGKIDITVLGGTAPYDYLWNTTATTQNISNLTAGTYRVTATDSRGCTADTVAVVKQPDQITFNRTITPPSCPGYSDGKIDITVSGGSSKYTYRWSHNGKTTEDLDGITKGTYTVTATDSKGCVRSATYVVNDPTNMIFNVLSNPVTCYGSQNGSIKLNVSGGTPGYSYLWSPGGETDNYISGLAGGSYSVTVTDNNGCTFQKDNIIVLESTSPLSATIAPTNVSCFNGNNGTISITPVGGTPEYTFRWSNGETTTTITNLSAGNYDVTVTDKYGCIFTPETVTITQPEEALSATIEKTDVSCYGGSNGTISIATVGGTEPYTYVWEKDGMSFSTNGDLTDLAAGTYTVTVTDGNGCTFVPEAVTITQPE